MQDMNEASEKIVSAPDFSVVKPEHIGKWVALSSNYKKLLAVGETLAEVLRKTGRAEVVVMQVMPNTGYAPVFR